MPPVVVRLLAVVALGGALWALLVRLSGGFVISAGGIALSSTDPIRPLVAAIIAGAAYVLVSARADRTHRLPGWTRRVAPRWLAALIAVGSVITSLTHHSATAGGGRRVFVRQPGRSVVTAEPGCPGAAR